MSSLQTLSNLLIPLGKIDIPGEIENIAAVLIPIGWNSETKQYEIWMTKRTMKVNTHKGQIGFPGGYREEQDVDLLHTALREVYEEIGVPSDQFKILGRLNPVNTHRGDVLVYPFVAMAQFPLEMNLSQDEVDRLVILPVERLLTEGLKIIDVAVENFVVKSPGIWIGEELIWGASAKMLEELLQHMHFVFDEK